jgi:hypothetical protein
MSQPVRLFVSINYVDGGEPVELEIGRATAIKTSGNVVMHIDRQPDGRHLLIASADVLQAGRNIADIKFHRRPAD